MMKHPGQGQVARVGSIAVCWTVVCVACVRAACGEPVTFAVIGDFGSGDPATEGRVAAMIDSPEWGTDFILTTGDNNYGRIDAGATGQWDATVGQFYGRYILARSDGAYPQQTGTTQRFFPTIGNHDATSTGTGQTGETGGISPGFVDYFQTDPGRPEGRLPQGVIEEDRVYYDFQQGDAHFFVLDSDHARRDPALLETQKAWLRDGLENSTARWNFVALHHSPYSSATVHGNHGFMQWPFAEWGADAVFGGHDHIYERNTRLGVPYFVSGVGGKSIYDFAAPNFFSDVRYNEQFGAMRVTLDGDRATFDFLSIDDGAGGAKGGALIDHLEIDKSQPRPQPTVLIDRGSTWSYLDDGSDLGTDWRAVEFPPSASWPVGSAELGYGEGDEATTVACGPSAPACNRDNFATTYFRKTFQVDPAALEGVGRILLEMVHDDGAAVYLNGQEVARSRLAPQAGFDTFATRPVSGDKRETEFIPFAIDPELLHPGENVLAVEIHQASATSSDVSFDLQLTTDFAPLPPETITLLPAGSTWSYLDDGSDQGTAWREADFAPASQWPTGPAELGYGDGDEATRVGFVDADPNSPGIDKNATTYFRTSFDVEDASRIESLQIELLRDDGAAVYLNGSLVALSNLVEGAAFDTYAGRAVSGSGETSFFTFDVPAELLVDGQNVLAVEVHQAGPTSSDISFDLRVLATLRAVPEPGSLVLALAVAAVMGLAHRPEDRTGR